jgi:hypothetical protein
MIDLTRDHLRLAAQLRAATGIGTPDALQLAASVATRCSDFVTNDRRMPGAAGSPSDPAEHISRNVFWSDNGRGSANGFHLNVPPLSSIVA